jgi:hypothetical protein
MNIEKINSFFSSDQLSQKKKAEDKSSEVKNKSGSDKLEISDQAKRLQNDKSVLDLAKAQMSKVPEIRQTRIDEVKGKLAQNYYNDEQVVADVAKKLADSPELVSALKGENQIASNAKPEDVKKLSVIYNRIDRKFYESVEALDKIAAGILKDIQK